MEGEDTAYEDVRHADIKVRKVTLTSLGWTGEGLPGYGEKIAWQTKMSIFGEAFRQVDQIKKIGHSRRRNLDEELVYKSGTLL